MPKGVLSHEDRLRIQVTHLTTANKNHKATIRELRETITHLKLRISELESKLEDKEL